MPTLDILMLKRWFLESKRSLPWREDPTPYRVLVSEIMLQQTQATTVIPYFLRWMEQFPSIESLATAPLDEVIKAWEGLGYYSRARNLHAAAKQIAADFHGVIPDGEEALAKIKGIGPYTTGAILSFAFKQRKAAVDGNVIRVLTRLFAIEKDVSKTSTQKEIRTLAENLLPEKEPWVIAEALIELGAIVCKKKPLCLSCPLKGQCVSFARGHVEQFPIKGQKIKTTDLSRAVAIILAKNCLLISRGSQGSLMADLHEFPYFDSAENPLQTIQKEWEWALELREALPVLKQFFTRYRVTLHPYIFHADQQKQIPGYFWIPVHEAQKLAFSSGHRKLLLSLLPGIRNTKK